MHKMKVLLTGLAIIVAAASLYGSYLFGRNSPPAVVRLTENPAGIAFDVRQANSIYTRFSYYDYGFDGTLDRVSILDKDGKRVDIIQTETTREVWDHHLKSYRSLREYAKLQLE